MPALHIGASRVFGYVVDVCYRRVKVGRRGKVRRITHHRSSETPVELLAGTKRLGGRLVDRGIDDVWAAVGEKVLAAGSVEVLITDPVSAADDGPGTDAVCHPEARAEIVEIRIDERPIV